MRILLAPLVRKTGECTQPTQQPTKCKRLCIMWRAWCTSPTTYSSYLLLFFASATAIFSLFGSTVTRHSLILAAADTISEGYGNASRRGEGTAHKQGSRMLLTCYNAFGFCCVLIGGHIAMQRSSGVDVSDASVAEAWQAVRDD